MALSMNVTGNKITFGIDKRNDIGRTEGTMIEKGRGDVRCPLCKQTTLVEELRRAGLEGRLGERMVAAIVERKVKQVRSIRGRLVTVNTTEKHYRSVEDTDLAAFKEASHLAELVERPSEPIRPEVTLSGEYVSSRGDITVYLYGLRTWGALFNARQTLAMQTIVDCLGEAVQQLEKSESDTEYRNAVLVYLGLWVSRNAMRFNTVGRWDSGGETFQSPFDMAKIAMVWDFPEANPFNHATGGALSQLNWILRVIAHESVSFDRLIHPARVIRGDAAGLQIKEGAVDVVVTDPPYFDEIAYSDLSDLFYVWLKRALGSSFSETFATPLTPKSEEATALKHRHGGNQEEAERHFTSTLAKCFAKARQACKPDGVLSVMFAHQTTEAWAALINALFEAGLNVTSTYPIDTELKNRTRGLDSAALEASITVTCRPREVGAEAASFRDVRSEIERVVAESVHRFWSYGFRGADLIVACYGPAVGVFGRYERVERADGTPVTVPELLDTARRAALKAIAGEFQGDDLSRLYFVWVTQCGVAEQPFDDLVKVAQMSIEDEDAMEIARHRGLFVVDGAKCRLALLRDRADRRNLGEDASAPLIDQLHHAMSLWKEEQRNKLVDYLRTHDLMDHAPFWKLAQALFEVLPRNEEDWKLVNALLGERETLRKEALQMAAPAAGRLFER